MTDAAASVLSADEHGLKGLSLDGRLRQVFSQMPQEQVRDLSTRLPEAARRHRLVYMRDGQEEVINLMLRPAGVMPDQLAYFHVVSLAILNALRRLPDLYIQLTGTATRCLGGSTPWWTSPHRCGRTPCNSSSPICAA
jgi:hypothetical protein